MNFKFFQIDIKNIFLNGLIEEEVYVEQFLDFENQEMSNHIYKLKKALYGLKQAPRAWHDKLSKFLLDNNFKRKNIDKILFIKRKSNDLLIVQLYIDDIVFGATNEVLYRDFARLIQDEFEMSVMGELNFFLGLQIKQSNKRIFIN